MFVKKKRQSCLPNLQYYLVYFLLIFLSLVQVNVYIYIYIFNTNTGLMIKKDIKNICWRLLLIKKFNKKYTLTCINEKKCH